jgi:hypothetical protein
VRGGCAIGACDIDRTQTSSISQVLLDRPADGLREALPGETDRHT